MNRIADRIAQDIKDIAQTRAAIAEKFGDIEQHIGQTMQHARTTMTRLADQTVSAVRHTMQATKHAFDPRVHADRHPWAFLGGALLLGYAAGVAARRGGCGSIAGECVSLLRTRAVRGVSILSHETRTGRSPKSAGRIGASHSRRTRPGTP